jgi:hypothetical protein
MSKFRIMKRPSGGFHIEKLQRFLFWTYWGQWHPNSRYDKYYPDADSAERDIKLAHRECTEVRRIILK